MKKLLIGGSPCTHWSIAQKNNRETKAEGIGWELFKNYLIAKEKFKPDFFLYENNKSAAQAIKDQISKELRAPLQYINSALVSAQNRQRFYAHNIPNVPQPENRGILLRDILESGTDLSQNEKSYALTTRCNGAIPEDTIKRHRHTMVAEPVLYEIDDWYFKGGFGNDQQPNLIGKIICDNSSNNNGQPAQGTRIYSPYGKMICMDADSRKYIIDKAISNKQYPVYEVRNGFITIKDKQYPIKLADGYYIIRKLTVKECCRLQTLPDDYCRAVSATQAYRGLGNGWTAEVIIHILKHMSIPHNEEIVVLSMYDGIGTGRYCLDKMGYKNIKYYAYEIDKYPIQVAMSNYPDIIQCGDAFQVREDIRKCC